MKVFQYLFPVLILFCLAVSSDAQEKKESKFAGRWNMLGVRFHQQDFGIVEQYNKDSCNCTEGRKLLNRANITGAVSWYKNFSRRWAVSADLGLSYGYIGKLKALQLNEPPKIWLSTLSANGYYHFSGNQFALQPYIFSGVHAHQKGSNFYVSVPAGIGSRYMLSGGNLMFSFQVGYGFHVGENVNNSIIYSTGLFFKLGRKNIAKQTSVLPQPVLQDKDGDGLPDDKDNCPDLPGPAENGGCPLPDTDNDGVPDKDDKCPVVAGPKSNNGCPEDTDGDGIPDSEDKCPAAAGPKSNNGCPVPKKDTVKKNERITPVQPPAKPETPVKTQVDRNDITKLTITPAGIDGVPEAIVYFDLDKYILKPEGEKTIRKAAAFLKKRKDFRVILAGHTDSRASAEYNMKLSKNRVLEVRKQLLKLGVGPDRLLYDYFGKSRLVTTSADEANQARNRRVEFKFVKD